MRKLLVMLLAMTALSTVLSAQEKEMQQNIGVGLAARSTTYPYIRRVMQWSAEVGIGMTTWAGENSYGVNDKFAYRFGAGVDFPVGRKGWSIYTGLALANKGAKGTVDYEGEDVDVTVNQMYLEIPGLVTYYIPTKKNFNVMVGGGLYLAYGIGGKVNNQIEGVEVSYNTFGQTEEYRGLRRFDMGVKFRAGLDFPRFFVTLNTANGFIPLEKDMPSNWELFLSAGVKF